MLLAPKAFAVGLIRALTSPKSVLFLYLPNLLIAALVTVPIYKLADGQLARTPGTRSFLERFDAAFLADATRVHEATLGAAAATTRVAGIVAFLVNLFLMGGVIAALADRQRPHNFTTFFAACGRHLLPFVRLLVPAGVVLCGLSVLNDRAAEGLTWLFNDFYQRAASAELIGWALLGKTAAFLLLYALLVKVPMQFARIGCVIDDDRAMLRGYFRGLALCLQHPFSIGLFLLLFAVLTAGLFYAHDLMLRHIDMQQAWQPLARFDLPFNPAIEATTVVIVVSQLFVLAQQMLTIVLVAGLLYIYRELAEPPPEPDPELVYARDATPEDPSPRRRHAGSISSVHGIGVLLVCVQLGAQQDATAEEPLPAPPGGPWSNEYRIEVSLDRANMALLGRERVTFRNLGTDPVGELPFHLYPNAFSNTHSQWARDGRQEQAVIARGAADGGYLEIRAIRDADGADLAAATRIDETVMRVTLPEPLPPGGEIVLHIEFTTRLPRILARMGKLGVHINAMQWFPKLAAHRNDTFIDWPFHNPSEFAADFGRYEVAITLPRDYVVEASGDRVGDIANAADGTATTTFQADAVHDFAWCANPHFVRRVERTRRGTELVLLNQPFLEPKAQLTLDAVRFAMETLDDWLFPYPYQRLVIDAQPHGQGGGMEYPGLFTISARSPEFARCLRDRSENPAGVAIHEFVHQYFYGLVANNEFEEAWLDEGLTSYLTNRLLEEFFGTSPGARGLPLAAAAQVYTPALSDGGPLVRICGYRQSPFQEEGDSLFGFELPQLALRGMNDDRFAARKATYAAFAEASTLRTRSWEVLRRDRDNAYIAIAYAKPALMLRTLERQVGWDRMLEFLRTWSRRYAWKHPNSDDFIALADELLGGESAAFLGACIDGRATVDWCVVDARATADRDPIGYLPQHAPGEAITSHFPPASGPTGMVDRIRTIVRRLGTKDGTPASATPTDPATPAQTWSGSVVVQNRGTLRLPVELELRFADGTSERRQLDGLRDWYQIDLPSGPARLVAAEVDPDRRIALDLDVTNNARLTIPDRAAARVVASFYQFWVQSLLSSIAWLS